VGFVDEEGDGGGVGGRGGEGEEDWQGEPAHGYCNG
jgi:hypothetical protein